MTPPSQDDYDYEPSQRPRAGRNQDDDLDNDQRVAPRAAAAPAGQDSGRRLAARRRSKLLHPGRLRRRGRSQREDCEPGRRSDRGGFRRDHHRHAQAQALPFARRRQAIEYGIGVGREGFAWKGIAQIGRKAFWPGWTPPPEMLLRRPDLPRRMDGGMENPLGARALYLFKGDKDTLFRIHGTNEPDTIGQAVSSGCIRMLNADVIDLYRRVSKGARVVVR
jgi:hypothetical protein